MCVPADDGKLAYLTRRPQVRDDGDGMTLADLKQCGQKSSTSKLQAQSQLRDWRFSCHGFRGESLASISEFCLLDIVSTSRSFPAESARKVTTRIATSHIIFSYSAF